MIGNIKTAIAVGIIVCIIPAITVGQTFNSMPHDTINTRFYKDVFRSGGPYNDGNYTIKHPGLTLNGFDNGGNNSHGYGLKQILQILYNKGEDPLMEANFNQIVSTSRQNILNPASTSNYGTRRGWVWQNSNIAQSRAFIALERYICYKNGVIKNIPDSTGPVWNYNQAIDSLKSVLTLPSNYLLLEGSDFAGGDADQVKFTRALMNMARALDLYLALENAFKFYGETNYTNLLSKTQKANLEAMIKVNMDDLHTYEHKKIEAFFTNSNLYAEPGNRNLKIFAAIGYAALTMQAYYDPTDIDSSTTMTHISSDCTSWLDETFQAIRLHLIGLNTGVIRPTTELIFGRKAPTIWIMHYWMSYPSGMPSA